jgi:hypothetical protein
MYGVWRSVRMKGETKTRSVSPESQTPHQIVTVLREDKAERSKQRLATDRRGPIPAGRANVRRDFRPGLRRAKVRGLVAANWTPRGHVTRSCRSPRSATYLSKRSHALLGRAGGNRATAKVCRHEHRPAIKAGAAAMDATFGEDTGGGDGA